MFDSPFLILPVDLQPEKLLEALDNLPQYLNNTLTIQLHSSSNLSNRLPALSAVIHEIYSNCDKNLPLIDVRVNVESIRTGKWLTGQPDALLLAGVDSKVRDQVMRLYGCSDVINLLEASDVGRRTLDTEDMVEVSVLGGTFDRIHLGHRIMLVEAVLRATRRVVVGVTDATMTKGKKLPELILPVQQRINDVQNFLRNFDSTLTYEVVPISDPFGPTATDPDMDLIVVSQETLRGGQKVNELRATKALKELKIHVIQLVEEPNKNPNFEEKISSSNRRFDLLGSLIREPYHRDLPYVIALVGGSNSGKSTAAKILEEKGAVIVAARVEAVPMKVNIIEGGSDGCNEVWLCAANPKAPSNFTSEIQPNVIISLSFDLDCLKRQLEVAWAGLQDRL